MYLPELLFWLSINCVYITWGQLTTEVLTQPGLTATGGTVLATGATVTFTPGTTTVTLSIGPGITVTVGGSAFVSTVPGSRYVPYDI